MAGSIEAMRAVVDKIATANIGYDQSQRWTWLAGKTIVKNKECDCSSLVAGIAYLAGYPIHIEGACNTGNLASLLRGAGWAILQYSGLSRVRAGDVLIKPGHHTEFAYSASRFYGAHIDERGKTTGGKPGNQSGRETGFSVAYCYPGGWTYVARPPDTAAKAESTARPVLKRGMSGTDVKVMQTRLIAAGISCGSAGADGIFGPDTQAAIKTLQTKAKITADGKFGAQTNKALQEHE